MLPSVGADGVKENPRGPGLFSRLASRTNGALDSVSGALAAILDRVLAHPGEANAVNMCTSTPRVLQEGICPVTGCSTQTEHPEFIPPNTCPTP